MLGGGAGRDGPAEWQMIDEFDKEAKAGRRAGGG
jgi:hypothetical protein